MFCFVKVPNKEGKQIVVYVEESSVQDNTFKETMKTTGVNDEDVHNEDIG